MPFVPYRARISALGTYVPPRLLTNQELSTMVDTTDEWIKTRTGIVERHLVEPGMATSDMAIAAARDCLEQRDLDPAQLQVLILATVTPDMMFPSTACLVQQKLSASRCWGFDISAACCGFLYALTTGAQLIAAGAAEHVLVIGADTMSSIIDYQDRATCVLFGDGAGAVLLERAPSDDETGFLDFIHQIEGEGAQNLFMPAGGSRRPASQETVAKRMHYVHQEGQQVFKYAVRKMYEVCKELLSRNHLTADELDCFIPHQANRRIITATGERLGLDPERIIINIGRYGNTTAATLPLAMAEARERGLLRHGSLTMLAAVGAGYTAGATLLRWSL